MGDEIKNRRMQGRCVKDVGMHCSLLNGHADKIVKLRNFSNRGVYFEAGWKFHPGSMIVLRAMGANDRRPADTSPDAPPYAIDHSDPVVCMGYRSHTVAKVQRCEKLEGTGARPLYGIGAEIQILTD